MAQGHPVWQERGVWSRACGIVPPAWPPHPGTATAMLQGTASAALSRPRCGAPGQARTEQEEEEEEDPPASPYAAATQLAPEALVPTTVLHALSVTPLSPGCPHTSEPPVPHRAGAELGTHSSILGDGGGGGCG